MSMGNGYELTGMDVQDAHRIANEATATPHPAELNGPPRRRTNQKVELRVQISGRSRRL